MREEPSRIILGMFRPPEEDSAALALFLVPSLLGELLCNPLLLPFLKLWEGLNWRVTFRSFSFFSCSNIILDNPQTSPSCINSSALPIKTLPDLLSANPVSRNKFLTLSVKSKYCSCTIDSKLSILLSSLKSR